MRHALRQRSNARRRNQLNLGGAKQRAKTTAGFNFIQCKSFRSLSIAWQPWLKPPSKAIAMARSFRWNKIIAAMLNSTPAIADQKQVRRSRHSNAASRL